MPDSIGKRKKKKLTKKRGRKEKEKYETDRAVRKESTSAAEFHQKKNLAVDVRLGKGGRKTCSGTAKKRAHPRHASSFT